MVQSGEDLNSSRGGLQPETSLNIINMRDVLLLLVFNSFISYTSEQSDCSDADAEIPNVAPVANIAALRQAVKTDELLWEWLDSPRERRDLRNERDLPTSKEVPKQKVEHHENVDEVVKSRVKRSRGRVRKEYRQMGVREMETWHECLQLMKNSGVYDEMTNIHPSNIAPAAHGGVAFIGWHRVYLWEFERRMRRVHRNCRNVTIPYWDSAVDSILPDHTDSVLWTDQFWGNNAGVVRDGQISPNWQMTEDCRENGWILRRAIRGQAQGLYERQEIFNLFPPRTFKDFMITVNPTIRAVERAHNALHTYFGRTNGNASHLSQLKCSPSDPVFWMLHCMVDKVFDEWSQLPERRALRPDQYPVPGVDGVDLEDMAVQRPNDPPEVNRERSLRHLGNSSMMPFRNNDGEFLQNRDALRRRYRCPYTRRPSRINCVRNRDCGGPQRLYFCDLCNRCASKIRPGGRCDERPNRACYCAPSTGRPRCVNNICQCIPRNSG